MALSSKHTVPSSSGFRHILSSPDYKFNKGNFLIFARQNNENRARLGVSVRKRDYKLATHRNKIKRRLFDYNIKNFYMTDVISRSSITMANCSREILNKIA